MIAVEEMVPLAAISVQNPDNHAKERRSGKKMILVTGAVGNIGSLVVRELKDRGAAIRAFVRDLRCASSKLGDDIELVPGDFAERERIRHALEGIDSVFSRLRQRSTPG